MRLALTRTSLACLLGAVVAFCAGLSPAAAQDRASMRQACMADVRQYCPGIRPGDNRLRDCMRANFEKLSPACREAITAAKAN